MYDELVKRLRSEAVYLPEKFSKNAELLDALMKAADAIEELQKAVNFHKFNSEFWEDKYNSLADEKWIQVTERLPDALKEVYVTDGEYIARANLLDEVFPGDQPCWSYSGLGEITHWCERILLPEPPKEET